MGIDLARSRTLSAFRHPKLPPPWPLAPSLPTFFFGVPTMVLSLFGGVLADRVDRRRLLITTQALFAIQAAVLAALTWFHLVRVWHIYLLSFVNGVTMAADSPAPPAPPAPAPRRSAD